MRLYKTLLVAIVLWVLENGTAFAGAIADQCANSILANPPNAAVIADTKEMYNKIKKLTSKVDSGYISYRDFAQLSSELGGDFAVFSGEQRDRTDIVDLIKDCVDRIELARGFWNLSITSDGGAWGADAVREYKNTQLQRMYEQIRKVESNYKTIDNMFYKLKKIDQSRESKNNNQIEKQN